MTDCCVSSLHCAEKVKMKTVKQLYGYLDNKIPRELSCSWDNDGMMVCATPDKRCERVLLTLDITNQAVDYAIDNGFSLIVSHHPLIFKKLSGVCAGEFVCDKIIKLVQSGVSACSFHTRLDALQGGVNDALAKKLGLVNTELFGTDEELIGRMGELDDPVCFEELLPAIKESLGATQITYVKGKDTVKKICLVGGDGKDFLKSALSAGADLYVTGSMSYNSMLDASDMGISVVEAGHYESEVPVLEALDKMIKEFDEGIYTEFFSSNPIKTL